MREGALPDAHGSCIAAIRFCCFFSMESDGTVVCWLWDLLYSYHQVVMDNRGYYPCAIGVCCEHASRIKALASRRGARETLGETSITDEACAVEYDHANSPRI
jgi:hypothetical protein